MNFKILISFVCLFFFNNNVKGQNIFKASAVIGFTMSQIDGDGLLGYDKLGLTGGLKVAYPVSEKIDINLELLYSQRGSQSGFLSSGIDIQKTHLDYFEIPVYASLKDWYIEDEDYYRINIHAGLSYGYLMNITSANGLFDDDISQFNVNDISWIIGPSYSINPRWTFTARFTRSFGRLFKSNNFINTDSLVSYFWTIRSEFNF